MRSGFFETTKLLCHARGLTKVPWISPHSYPEFSENNLPNLFRIHGLLGLLDLLNTSGLLSELRIVKLII